VVEALYSVRHYIVAEALHDGRDTTWWQRHYMVAALHPLPTGFGQMPIDAFR